MEPQGPPGPVTPVFIHFHVKCSMVSAKDDEDAESYVLHSNDYLQGITDEMKFSRLCLTLRGDGYLKYDSVIPMDNDRHNLQSLFADNS